MEEKEYTFEECVEMGQGFYPCVIENGSGLIVLRGDKYMVDPLTPIALFYSVHDGKVEQVMHARYCSFYAKKELIEPRFVLKIKE